MTNIKGNNGADFQGARGVNAADPLNDKDVVNLRTLRRSVSSFSSITLSNINFGTVGTGYPVYSGYSGDTYFFRSLSAIGPTLLMHTGDTITFEVDVNHLQTGYTWEHLWCASTGTRAIIRNNFTNNDAIGNFTIVASVQSTSPGSYSWIGGGSAHTIHNDFSSIGGGFKNTTSGYTNFIGGGGFNFTNGPYASIQSGFGNRAIREFSLIGNGIGNYNIGNFGLILNGSFNTGYSAYTTVINGASHHAEGEFSLIGNGLRNKITGNTVFNVILNGSDNHAKGKFSLIGNGLRNESVSDYSATINGSDNHAEGKFSLIGNGLNNNVYSDYSTVLNGLNATIAQNSKNSTIIQARNSKITGQYNIILNSRLAQLTGTSSTIINGPYHRVDGSYVTVAGWNNSAQTHHASIFGGSRNLIKGNRGNPAGTFTNILNGRDHEIDNNYCTIILNGVSNRISGGSHNLITVGSNNEILSSIQSSIIGGGGNFISGLSNVSVISLNNYTPLISDRVYTPGLHALDLIAATAEPNFVLADQTNGHLIISSITQVIGMFTGITSTTVGVETLWCATTTNSIIRNNFTNNSNTGNFTVVAAAYSDSIGNYSFIGGGSGQTISNDFSSIGGGFKNTTSGYTNFIGGGGHNLTDGPYASIQSGFGNRAIREFSLIGNGIGNYNVGNFGLILNGSFNTGYSAYTTVINGAGHFTEGEFNLLGNGLRNKITGNTGFNTILNGSDHVISDEVFNSGIIAGVQNFINTGVSNSSIVAGKNIIAFSSETMYSDHGVFRSLTSNTMNFVMAEPSGHLIISAITFSSGTGATNIDTVGLGYPVYSGFSSNIHYFRSLSAVGPTLLMHTGDTITFEVDVDHLQSGYTWEHLWCASTGSQSIIRNNLTNNDAIGNFTIVAAVQSTSPGAYSWIGGGSAHTVYDAFSSIGGGFKNITSGYTNFIGGGGFNFTNGPYASIQSGFSNRAIREFSLIGNGIGNYNVGSFGAILNGSFNTGNSEYSTVINGASHFVSGQSSTIINGTNHEIISRFSTIVNGLRNSINNSYYQVILNGVDNLSFGAYAFIGNGLVNFIDNNVNFSTILNGSANDIMNGAHYSSILAGNYHTIAANAANSAIIGGNGFTVTTPNTVMVPRLNIRDTTGTPSSILGIDSNGFVCLVGSSSGITALTGATNIGLGTGLSIVTPVTGDTLFVRSLSGFSGIQVQTLGDIIGISYTGSTFSYADLYWTAGTGANSLIRLNSNNIAVSGHSFVAAGTLNEANNIYATILNGRENIVNAAYGTIIGGKRNSVNINATYGIAMGNNNTINGFNSMAFGGSNVANGVQCVVFGKISIAKGNYSFSCGAQNTAQTANSTVFGYGNFSSGFIGGGSINRNVARETFIGQGSGNVNTDANAYNATIINGRLHTNNGYFGLIGQGERNFLGSNAIFATILNGESNVISAVTRNATIVGGSGLTLSDSNTVLVPYLQIHNVDSGGTVYLTYDPATRKVHYSASSGSTIPTGSTQATYIYNGINTYTGGTIGAYTINVTGGSFASIVVTGASVFNSISATSITGTTFSSGSTSFYDIFETKNKYKASAVTSSLFIGTPRKATIVFSNPFPDANYAISITGADQRLWTWESKTAAGFIINSNSNTALVDDTSWVAMRYET